MKIKCSTCKKDFIITPNREKTAKYCSRFCQSKGLLGKKQSLVTRKKKSESLKKAYASGARKAWNFRGFKITDGYKFIRMLTHPYASARGYIGEHRLVMEKKIGRYLKPRFINGKLQKKFELVHHIDGNRLNNKPKNLQLLTSGSHHSGHEIVCPKCKHRFVS